MPRPLSGCQSLTLNVKIWVFQVIKNSQLCHCVILRICSFSVPLLLCGPNIFLLKLGEISTSSDTKEMATWLKVCALAINFGGKSIRHWWKKNGDINFGRRQLFLVGINESQGSSFSTDGPTSLFLFIFALFSFSCWEGTGGNRIDGWTVHILNEAPSHLLTGYDSSRIFVVRMCYGTNQNSQFMSSQITFWPLFFWAGSLVKLIVLVASSSLCVFFLQSFFNLFLTMLPSWNLYAAQYQQKSHFWIYWEQNDMNFIKTKSCEKNMF